MKFRHEDLEVYKIAMKLVISVYKLAEKLPASEMYGLKSQLTRSVTSIPLNIAEGSGKHSRDDFARFIRNAIGSLLETDTNLKISINLKYINDTDYSSIDNDIKELYFKLIALHKSLKNNSNN
jgi:four helix bundle protein